MSTSNRVVCAVLRSPAHRLLSGSVALVHYRGRRTGRDITTPVQYVRDGHRVVLNAGRPRTKTWWRNFTSSHPLDICIEGKWTPMTGVAVDGSADPARAAKLAELYLHRFPRTNVAAATVAGCVFVECTPT